MSTANQGGVGDRPPQGARMSTANQGGVGDRPPQSARMSIASQGVWGIVSHREDA
jgi:hypothetical protein